MKLQVLGMGCPKCRKLYDAVKRVIGELGLDCELEKVEDLAAISAMGAMLTPALAIDGEIVVAGRVPSSAEIRTLLQSR